MRIVFFGSDDFALNNLEALINSDKDIVACVTQPDRAKGRGLKVEASPIKKLAQKEEISVLQPADINEILFIDELEDLNADLFVVIAYGKILPQKLLNIPKIFCINVHASMLPKYRGAAPINWVIINGEKETGVSIIKLNTSLDAGDIIFQDKIKINESDDSVSLREKLCALSIKSLLKTLELIKDNEYALIKQKEKEVTLAPKLSKETGLISWDSDAVSIHNKVRGLLPWPAAYTYFNGKLLKILETEVVPVDVSGYKCAEVIEITKKGFVVATPKGALQITKVHPESSKPMDAKSFCAGYSIQEGSKFGN